MSPWIVYPRMDHNRSPCYCDVCQRPIFAAFAEPMFHCVEGCHFDACRACYDAMQNPAP